MAAVSCPGCCQVFGGRYPLRSYAQHRGRGASCRWTAPERAAFDRFVTARRLTMTLERQHEAWAVEGPERLARRLARREAADSARRSRDRIRAKRRSFGPAVEVPAAHVGHELFDHARQIVNGRDDSAYVQDLRSVVVLALLEGVDPREAIHAFQRAENAGRPWGSRSLFETVPGTDRLQRIETIAAPDWFAEAAS